MLTLLMMIVGFVAAGSSYGIVIFSIIAIAINLFSYFFSDSIVLRAYGAKVIDWTPSVELSQALLQIRTV